MPKTGSRARAAAAGLLLQLAAGSRAQSPTITVSRYEIFLALPDSGDTVRVDALVHFRAGSPRPDTLVLDLEGMTVDTVALPPAGGDTACGGSLCRVAMAPVPFSYDGSRLRIPLGAARTSLVVRYHGAPRDGLIIGRNAYGRRAIFADNWPERARYWLPTLDRPADKAPVTLWIQAPSAWKVVGNGQALRTEEHARGRWYWLEHHPIPTYTMVIGAGELSVSTHRPVVNGKDSVPITVWTYPEDSAYADSVPFKYATEIVETLQRIIGPFPYEKLAHVESSTRFGGMENASAIFYAERPYVERRMGEGVMRHETAHQWFGDAVTERDWHHLWLSEGFASYFDLVAGAALHGDSVLGAGMRANAERYMRADVVSRPIIDPAEGDLMKLLNANNYQKGSWVLHMLRGEVGDSAFFRGVRDYYRRYRDSTALSQDFERAIERAAGRDLGWFFAQWLGQPGYPQLDAGWTYDGVTRRLTLTVTQTQPDAWGTFRLPRLTVEYAANGRTERRVIAVDGRRSVDIVELPAAPEAVRVDPDGKLLLRATVTRTDGKAGNE